MRSAAGAPKLTHGPERLVTKWVVAGMSASGELPVDRYGPGREAKRAQA